MKLFFSRKYLLFAFVVLFGSLNINYCKQIQDENLVGTWQGKLNINGMNLRIVFRIDKKDSKFVAFLDSPDQGAKDIPVSDVLVKGDSVYLLVTSIKGKFEGIYQKDSVKLAGVWKQGAGTLPLTMKKIDKVEEVKRPQEPKPPYPYNEEEVTFENKNAGNKLAGTLTLPKEGKNFPAVVLITGSGPQDRNEEVFKHKPFLIIADYLTRNGIAVLRFDDRGIGKSTGDFNKATSKDLATDAVAGVEYLKTRPEINHAKIGLIGHSEGGMIAPMIASNNKDVAFIVMLAGPGMPIDKLLVLQLKLISEAEGEKPEIIKKASEVNKKIFALLKTENDTTVFIKKVKTLITDMYNTLGDEDKKTIPDLNAYMEQQYKPLLTPWFKYFISYNPKDAIEKVKCPVLALNGGKDLQVPAKENLAAVEKALKKGKNKNYKVIELPGLNHLFQTTSTGRVSEYIKNEESFSPKALEIMGNWIKEITAK